MFCSFAFNISKMICHIFLFAKMCFSFEFSLCVKVRCNPHFRNSLQRGKNAPKKKHTEKQNGYKKKKQQKKNKIITFFRCFFMFLHLYVNSASTSILPCHEINSVLGAFSKDTLSLISQPSSISMGLSKQNVLDITH